MDLTDSIQNTENTYSNNSQKILTRNNREYNKTHEERIEYLRDVNEYFWLSLTSTDKNKDKLMVRFKKNGAQIMEYNLNEQETITIPPKLGQRSLVIVFDGTGSMFDDLAQMIEAAELITKEFTESENNPIYNYIFVPFRDPYIGPKLVTQDVHKFLEEIRQVYLFGGGDCPESSIGAINLALESALPKSDIFIFTDATAKDYKLDQYTMELIQKHQATLTFLLTGHCKAKHSEGYRVYENLALLSNGEVYNLQKINIREVLLGIRSNLQNNKVPLRYLHSKEPGQHNFNVPVDSNLKQFSISVAGLNPTIDILDPNLEKFNNVEEVLNLNELKILNVPNPEPGNWNVKTDSNSEHSVKLTGLSDLNFNFEFVTNEHSNSNFSTANINPVLQRNNILNISPSNPQFLHNLTSVELEVIPIEDEETVSSDQNVVPQNIILPLHKLKPELNSELIIFGTDEFQPPDMFKIYVNGFDFDGNPLQHLLSTAIKAIKGDAPRILSFDNFVQSQEGESTVLECKVLSQNSVEIFWLRKNNQIESEDITLEKYNDFYISSLIIRNLTVKDSGPYTCVAENEYGYDTKYNQLVVKEREVPLNVHMIQDHLNGLNEGDVNYQLSCIGTPSQNLNFQWYFNNQPIQHNDLEIDNGNLLFKYIDRTMAGDYTCIASNGISQASDSSYIDIKYGPEILRPLEEEVFVNYGEYYELDCESVGNPQPQKIWENLNNSKVNLESGLIQKFGPSDASTYKCIAFNNVGPPKEKVFKVKGKAAGPPKIQKDFIVLEVNISETLNLSCKCDLCDPIINSVWTREDFNQNYEPETLQTFELIEISAPKQKYEKLSSFNIVLDNITREDQGIYTCRLDNEHGADTWSFDIIVLEPSKIFDITSNSIIINEGKFKAIESENYEFICEADGNPVPEIKWFKYNEFLEKEEIIHETNDNEENHIFQISNTNRTHGGKYACQAQNSIGFDSKDFSIEVLFGPKLKSTEETVIITESGKEVTMQCNIEGNPLPEISWKYNNQSLQATNNNSNINNEFLWFTASLQNSGIYECEATNELGFVKKNIILIVFAAPRIEPPIKEIITTNVGDNTFLPCKYTGYPVPDIKWRFNNSPQDSDFIVIKDSEIQKYGENELFIKNVSRAMEGIYLCEAENEHGIVRKSYFLEVNYPPHIISNIKPTYKLKPNEELEIICGAEGKPEPEIGWEKSTTKTKSNLGAILKLTNTDKSTSGVYTCIAKNSAGTDVKETEIIALAKPKFTRRDINNLIPNITAENGQDLTLYCPVEYADYFIWYKDNIILNNYDNSIGQFLNLKNVTYKESGNYTCSGINEVGLKNYTQILYVNSPPYIHAIYSSGENFVEPNFKEIVAQRGDNKILKCLTNGFPLPKVKWFKDKTLISNDWELNLINVNVAHSGEYICSAYNQYGSDEMVFNVQVIVPPSSELPKKNWIEIREGNDLILECIVYGNPWPKFNWIKDGQHLTDELQEALIVPHSGLKDNGVYKCIAENKLGSEEIEFNVNIMAPPTFNINPNKNELVFNIKDTIELECSVYGNPKPILTWTFNNKIILSTSRISEFNLIDETKSKQIEYVFIDKFGNAFTYYDPNEIFGSQLWENHKNELYGKVIRTDYETNLTLIIDNEKMKKNGIYTCYAINAIGTNSLDTKVEIYYKPTLDKNHNSSESITILKGLPLILSCSLHGNPRPKIIWTKDNSYISTNDSNHQILFSHDNKTLAILSTNDFDSGIWTCIGKNLLGEEQKSFNVEILSAPELVNESSENNIDIEPSKLKIISGSKILLKCPVIGNPLPEIFWLKENNETSIFGYPSDKYENLFAENSPELVINNIQESGLYSCFANNSLGSIEKKFTVEILKMPDIILTEPNELIVTEFNPVKIRCQVEGNPKPEIYWYKDDHIINLIEDKSLVLDSENQTLKISSAQLKHEGMYACFAKNELGDKLKYVKLNVKESAIWSPWDSWYQCNVTCGSGVKYRKRRCIRLNGEPAINLENCNGNDFESKLCEMPPCPIDGGWSYWSQWQECSMDCWNGIDKIPIRKRFRVCNNPPPRYGGEICYGIDVQEEECDLKLCTTNGGWSAWSSWSACSVSCGIGVKERFRFCNNPSPINGGQYCEGLDKSVQSCTLNPCPIDGNWSEWSSWSECSQTCGTGLRKRIRQCNNPKPEYGGAICDGSNIEIAKCKKRKCDNKNLLLKSFPKTQQTKFTPTNIFEMPFINTEYENEESDGENDSEERSENEYAFATGSKQIISKEFDYSNSNNNITDNSTNFNVEDGKFKVIVEFKSFKSLDKDLKEVSLYPGKAPFFIQRVNPCPFGKELNTNNECIDIDQCKIKNICKENEVCENQSDGYKCVCLNGFDLNKDNGLCEDLDECLYNNIHNCSHNCTNTQGSYICSCPNGFVLKSNNKECESILQSAEELGNEFMADHASIMLKDPYVVIQSSELIKKECPNGFEESNEKCEDVNECEVDESDCDENYSCLNTFGSYKCIETLCPPEYKKTEIVGQCILMCNETFNCNNNAQIAEIISHTLLSVKQISKIEPFLKIVNYGINRKALPYTKFIIDETISDGNLFKLESVEVEKGITYLYTRENLQQRKLYKLIVEAESYDEKTGTLNYLTKFIIFLYII